MDSSGCHNRPMTNPNVCAILFFEEDCQDCHDTGLSIRFKKRQPLTEQFSEKIKSIRIRQGCQLIAVNESDENHETGRIYFTETESKIKVRQHHDTIITSNLSVTSLQLTTDVWPSLTIFLLLRLHHYIRSTV